VCVCGLSCPARYACAPYCTVNSGLSGTTIFYRIISHRERFSGVGLQIIKCVLIFSTKLWTEIFLILRRMHQETVTNVSRCSRKVRVFLLRFLMKLENFLDRFSKNPQSINFHENPSSGGRVVACGRTGRQDEANTRFPQLLRKHLNTRISFTVIDTCLYLNW
jgi:hypothetical protein